MILEVELVFNNFTMVAYIKDNGKMIKLMAKECQFYGRVKTIKKMINGMLFNMN